MQERLKSLAGPFKQVFPQLGNISRVIACNAVHDRNAMLDLPPFEQSIDIVNSLPLIPDQYVKSGMF